MSTFTVRPEGIIRQPALTIPGNATGSEAACTALNASSIRTLLSLSTVSDVTFDIVRATTSVQTPLVNNASAALTLGNATYGVTVPGAATFSGDISMSKTSAQGYITAYNTAGTGYIRMSNAGSTSIISTSFSGVSNLNIAPDSGLTYCYTAGVASTFSVYNSGGSQYTSLTHGTLSTSSGNLNLVPTGGTVAVTGAVTTTGAITASGDISMHKATQGYIYAYNTAGTGYIRMSNAGATSIIATSFSGVSNLLLAPDSGLTYCYTGGVNSTFSVYNSSGSKYTTLTHDGTNGILSTSSGNLNLVPGGGTVAVTGGITASGNLSFTGGLSTGTVTKSANYTTTADDYCVNVTANSIDITFETAVGCANREHEVINSGSGVVTLKTTSAQTISGSASGALTLAQWKSIRVKSDGSNWLIMSQIT